jgi:CheY-like chemotaxis protein
MPAPLTIKILAVDDEAEVLEYLSNILKRAGYEIITATNGKDAVKLAVEHKPGLIILDIILPDLDGGEIASILSRNPSTSFIPIIFLTGILTKDEEALVTKSGKYPVIAKPVTKEKLLAMIKKILPA